MLQRALWTAFSLVIFSSCATVKRPDVDLMIVNAPGKKRCGYNLFKDYDDDGHIKAGAKPVCRTNLAVVDLNKAMLIEAPPKSEENPGGSTDPFPDGIARLKAYIKTLREEYEKGCKF